MPGSDFLERLDVLNRAIIDSGMQWVDGNLDAKLHFEERSFEHNKDGLKLLASSQERLRKLKTIIPLAREIAQSRGFSCPIVVSGEAGGGRTDEDFRKLSAEKRDSLKDLAAERARTIAEELGVTKFSGEVANQKRVIINGMTQIKELIDQTDEQVKVLTEVFPSMHLDKFGRNGKWEMLLKTFKFGLPLKPISLDDRGAPLSKSLPALQKAIDCVRKVKEDSPVMKMPGTQQGLPNGARRTPSGGASRSQSATKTSKGGPAFIKPGIARSPSTSSLTKLVNASDSLAPIQLSALVDGDLSAFETEMQALVDLVECGFVDPYCDPSSTKAAFMRVEGFTGDPAIIGREKQVLQLQDLREQEILALLVDMASSRGKKFAEGKFRQRFNLITSIGQGRGTDRISLASKIRQSKTFKGVVVAIILHPYGRELVASVQTSLGRSS